MKTYVKTHTNRTAALAHREKIKARGGYTTLFEENGTYTLAYSFPEKKVMSKKKPAAKKKAAEKKNQAKPKVLLDVLSPDGISIRLDDQDYFKDIDEAKRYFKMWKNRFKAQGYYSANYGRIDLADLADECEVVEIDPKTHLPVSRH